MNGEAPELGDVLFRVARLLVTEETLTADLERILRLATEVIQDCDGATVSLILEGTPRTAAATDRFVLDLDLAQYESENGPCLDAATTGVSVSVDFVASGEDYSHVAAAAVREGVTGSLSCPVVVGDVPIGSLNLYTRSVGGFADRNDPAGAVFASQVAVALVKSRLLSSAGEFVTEAQAESDRRSQVSVAEGVLMGIYHCSAEQAHGLMENASASERSTMLEVAAIILRTIDTKPEP